MFLQDVTVHRGQFLLGEFVIEYETRQPAYAQWVAIGLARTWDARRFVNVAQSWIVGAGRTEQEALDDLRQRVAQAVLMRDDNFAVAWAMPT